VDIQGWRDPDDLNPKPLSEEWDAGHYVVVTGIDDDHIYFMDPSGRFAHAYLPIEEFLERWHDTLRDGTKKWGQGIIVDGDHPLAKGALVRLDPLENDGSIESVVVPPGEFSPGDEDLLLIRARGPRGEKTPGLNGSLEAITERERGRFDHFSSE